MFNIIFYWRCVAGVPGAGGRAAARVRGERRGSEHGGDRGHHLPARPLRGHQALHRRVGRRSVSCSAANVSHVPCSYSTHFTSKVDEVGRSPVWEASHTFDVDNMVCRYYECFR